MKIFKAIHMKKHLTGYSSMLLGMVLIFTLGCVRPEEELKPATYPDTAEIFIDGFSAGLEYAAFGDSKLTAFTVDENVSYEGNIGTASMRFDIPNEGDPEGPYAGGIFRDLGGRDLSGYNALTFYAKATRGGTIDLLGFGTDFGENKYATEATIRVNTVWTKYIIPIPDPSKLMREEGLLAIAEGPENGEGYTIWLDVVKYEKLGTLAHPRPQILNGEDVKQTTFIGVNSMITGLTQTYNLANGKNQTVSAAPAYFEFVSSDSTVAKVDEQGMVSVVGQGTAVISATLAGVEAAGSLTIESLGEFQTAPVPDRDQADVISIFSDAYTNVPVDFYNGYFAPFQTTIGQDDIDIDGDKIISYAELNFVATEFKNPTVNATAMTHFHVDIQVQNTIEPGDFIKVQLGDFGPDGSFGGGDDVSGVYEINTAPPLVSNQWISLDIPFSDFVGLTQRANLAQIFFITDGTATELPGTITDILVDNMYFYKDDGSGGNPCTPEVGQSLDAADFNMTFQTDPGSAIGSFGGNYSYVTNPDSDNAVNPSCQAGLIARDGQQFANTQIEFASKFDFNANAGFKLKVWSPIAATNVLVKLEDKANSGVFAEVAAVTSVASSWEELTFDFAASESGKYDKIILFFELDSDIVRNYFIDDFKLYGNGGGGVMPPSSPAPTPPQAEANVISIYSDAYTDVPNSGYNNYGAAAFEEADISGDKALKYTFADVTNGNFQVIELGGANQIDAAGAGMTNFKFDLWFPNTVDGSTAFLTKLVDIGASTTEAIIDVNASSTPAIAQGQWLSFDFTLAQLQGLGLGAGNNIQQLVIDLVNSGEVYIDNIYFYKEVAGSGGSILELTFDDAASINDWNKVADATGPEASITWADGAGVNGGAMKVAAANPSDAAGKAYIFQLDATGLDYDGATDVTLTFDLKLDAPLVAAAVHLQTNIPDIGVTNNFDLQGQGLNESTYTSYSFDFNGVAPAATTFSIHFNFASGAVLNAGGELLIDNIKLIKK
jgi:hypothetical protein